MSRRSRGQKPEESILYPPIHLNWILARFRGYGFKGLFLHSYLNFFAWVGLYFTTPFIVLLLWLRNRSTDPGPTSHDRRVPRLVRLVIGIVGGLTLLTSIFLFLQPGFMIGTWPWQLTPLTARVMGALFALTGVGELGIALDIRWSAARIALQSQMIGIAAIGLAMVFSWSNFNQANPLTWIFLASILFLLVASPLLYIWMEAQGRRCGNTSRYVAMNDDPILF